MSIFRRIFLVNIIITESISGSVPARFRKVQGAVGRWRVLLRVKDIFEGTSFEISFLVNFGI